MQVLKLTSDRVNAVMESLVIVSMTGMCLIIFLQIVFRYCLNDALFWSEEVSRYLMIWSIFLGSTIALKRGELATISFIMDSLKGKARRFFLLMGNLSILIFVTIVLIYGIYFVRDALSYMTPTLPIPMGIQYSSVVVWAIVMLIHLVHLTFSGAQMCNTRT